jgi:hypothetical protein
MSTYSTFFKKLSKFYLYYVLPGHTWARACTKLGNIGDFGGQQAAAVRMDSDQQKALCVCVCVGWQKQDQLQVLRGSSEQHTHMVKFTLPVKAHCNEWNNSKQVAAGKSPGP